jgi:hypothetical protein
LRSVLSDKTVVEPLLLMKAGLVPASMAAPLGEKERAAAFDEDNPMAWIELQPPSSASSPEASKSKMAAASKAAGAAVPKDKPAAKPAAGKPAAAQPVSKPAAAQKKPAKCKAEKGSVCCSVRRHQQ